ncbi:hypothetical protein M9H77_33657 [Catharanthus roseus]|uniref:Uncharacterized protein n=1 Tax=Catharanthus roseus TaxID=4058 RepID=A0ACB9ZL47_CATRO|nr:hypothetical protein M9H77_33657 [Catharanthus roseus]
MKIVMTTKKKSCFLTARLLKNRKLQIKVNVAATAINNNSSLKKEPENQQVLEKKNKKTEITSAIAMNIGLKERKDNNDSLQINRDQSCNKKLKCLCRFLKDLSKKNVTLKGAQKDFPLFGARAILKLKEEEEADDEDDFDAERVVLLEKKRQLDKQREASRIALEEMRRKAELEVEDNFKTMTDFDMLINSCSSSGWDKENISNNSGLKLQNLLW